MNFIIVYLYKIYLTSKTDAMCRHKVQLKQGNFNMCNISK